MSIQQANFQPIMSAFFEWAIKSWYKLLTKTENIDNVASDSGYCDPKLVRPFYFSLKRKAMSYTLDISKGQVTKHWL
jgi:hypothetical protein